MIPSPKKPRNLTTKRKSSLKGGKSLCPQCPARYNTRQALIIHLKSEHPLPCEPRQRKTMPPKPAGAKKSETTTSMVESILLQAVDAAIQTSEMLQGCKEIQEEFLSAPDSFILSTPQPLSSPVQLTPIPSPSMDREGDSTKSLPSTLSPSLESSPLEIPNSPGEEQLETSSNTSCYEEQTVSSTIPVPVQAYLAENNLVYMPTRGDGLCILRAIHTNLRYSTDWGLSLGDMASALLREVETNKDNYSLGCTNTKDIVEGFKEYINKKVYTSEVTDIVIDALSQALSIRVTVISEDPTGHTNLISVSPHPLSEKTIPEVFLLRSDTRGDLGTHYGSVIPQGLIKEKLEIISKSEGERILRCPVTSQKYLMFQYPSRLSNLSPSPLTVENCPYTCVEQFFQSKKFRVGSKTHKQIMSTGNPFDMKKLGKRTPTCPLPKEAMDIGLKEKFSREGPLKNFLLSTKDCILVESTRDKHWGIGTDFSRDISPNSFRFRSNWVGSNLLGKKIMRIRAELLRATKATYQDPKRDTIPSSLYNPSDSRSVSGKVQTPSPPVSEKVQTPSPCSPAAPKASLSPAWANPPSSIKEAPKPRSPAKTLGETPRPLPTRALYLPPRNISSKEVIRLVTLERPTIGKRLICHNGKITSTHPEALKALKTPLILTNPSLNKPLKRFHSTKAVENSWLSTPVPRTSFTAMDIASNPRVAHVMKHDENHSHTIWRITTSFEGTQNSTHKEPSYLETSCGVVLNLLPYTPITRCTYCQSLTHSKKECLAEYSWCVFCAGHHLSSECSRNNRLRCARCFGPHKASDPICSEMRSAMEKQGLPVLPKPALQGKPLSNQAKTMPKSPEPENFSSAQFPQQVGSKPDHSKSPTKDKGFQITNPPNTCPSSRVPSLFESKFTSHRVEQLFSPSTYHKISQKLFPSLVSSPRSDRTLLPFVALPSQAIVEHFTNTSQTPQTQGATQLSPPPLKMPSAARYSNTLSETLTSSVPSLSSHLFHKSSHQRSLGMRYPYRHQCMPNSSHSIQLQCPVVGHVSNIPPFFIPFISHLHDILRRDTTWVMPR